MGAVGDLDPLTHADEVDGVLADDVAAPDGLHADLFLRPLAADPLAVEVGYLVVVATERLGYHFAHPYRSAGGGILLHLVVRLDDLHVEVVAEDGGHVLQHLETDVDPDRHVRCQYDGDILRQLGSQRPLFRGEAGGADDDCLPVEAADLQILQRHLRVGEVDEDVAPLDHRVEVVGDGNTDGAETGVETGILADHRVTRTVQGAGQLHPFSFTDGGDDPATHPPGSAADCDLNHYEPR